MRHTRWERTARHLLGTVGVVLLLAGCGTAPDPDEPGDAKPAEGVMDGVRTTTDRFLAAARDQLGLASAAPPAARQPAAPIARPAPAAAPRRPAESAPAPDTAPAASEAPVAFAPVPPIPPAPAPAAARPAAPVPVADTSLYSSTDAGVAPPAWRSPPVSASQLAGSATHVPALELIVGPDGTVERARLLRSSRQLPDMMILSSAKMWTFEPARLDGEPVRYRLVVRIDQDSALE